MRLKEKVALVTGGGSGIGAAVAQRFAAEGALIAIADVVPQGAEGVMAEITKKGGKAIFSQVDVRKRDEVHGMIEQVVKEFGRLDILINNAGVTRDNLCARMSEEEWDFVVDVSLKGTFLCSQAAYRPMRKQKYGRIINTASVAAFDGQVGQAAYSASKAGVAGMTLPVARDLMSIWVRVNTIAPGIFWTPMMASMDQKVQDALAAMVPFPKRLGRPDEYASLALEICRNSYMNGETIQLDGAIRMQPR